MFFSVVIVLSTFLVKTMKTRIVSILIHLFLSIILGKIRMDRGTSGSQRQAGKRLDRCSN